MPHQNREILSSTKFRPRRMLEIGIWDGGSTALWNELLQPEKLVAFDLLDRGDSTYFQRYVAERSLEKRVMSRWQVSQSDREALRSIVDRELGGMVDLIIDDGSHLYAPTRASFETLFPLLPPGGLYIIEDWAWEHWPEFQDPRHFWAGEESLTALVDDLVAATGTSKTLIRRLAVHEGFVVVERGDDETQRDDFTLTDHVRRRQWRRNRGRNEEPGDMKVSSF